MQPDAALNPVQECIEAFASRDSLGQPKSKHVAAQRAHFVGIGGAGMRALAAVMAGAGWRITGTDASSCACQELAPLGWHVGVGGVPARVIARADVLVYSAAVPARHPDRRLAARLGIEQLSYATMLGRWMQGRQRLAVAGTHGKSTTTAMVGEVLLAAGLNPTVVAGATPLSGRYTGGRAGDRDIVVVEACEFARSFLHLRPNLAVITGVEPDHFDCYPSFDDLVDSFCRFAGQVDRDGLLLVNHDCAVARRVSRAADCPVETYGTSRSADWQVLPQLVGGGRYRFQLQRHGRLVTQVYLGVPGLHNVANAAAAAVIALRAGAMPRDVCRGLLDFAGLRRRLEYVGNAAGVHIWDDYAHHPTEVAAVLGTLRQIHPHSRIRCVFQPHQASRTRQLFEAFADSLQLADEVAIARIFRAREGEIRPGDVTAEDLARRVREMGTAIMADHEIAAIMWGPKPAYCRGDVLVTLGAGDIWKISHAIADRF